MFEAIHELDKQLFLFANGVHNRYWDAFMYLISTKQIWIPFYLALIWSLYQSYSRKTATIVLLSILALVGAADATSTYLFKRVFEVLRPSHDPTLEGLVHLVRDFKGGSFGFISGHAINMFAIAWFTSFIFKQKRYTYLILGWAALISYSRIYLGLHFFADITVSAIIAFILAYIFYTILRFIKPEVASSSNIETNRKLRLFLIITMLSTLFISFVLWKNGIF